MTPSIWARCASGNDHGGGSRFRRQAGDRSHCRDESGDHTPVSPRRARQFVRDLEEGSGQQVYAPHYRAEWLAKISEAGVRRRAELYYVQFDTLAALRQEVRRELLAESRKHPATRLLRQIPSIGLIRAALPLQYFARVGIESEAFLPIFAILGPESERARIVAEKS